MAVVSDGGGGGELFYVPEADRGAALGTGGKFVLDQARVPELITGLRQALDRLNLVERDVVDASRVTPPGNDPFSAQAAQQFGRVANGGPESLAELHSQFKAEIQKAIDTISANAASADSQDSGTAGSFGGSS